ncbi:type VII secretion protein EccE [Mycobacterium talmoniae]|uniref:Type VII secretion protein EccE n=1 Tax=Mycobacterium talmoniae TaxID=1858794 RepID=A0A1S1MRZ1_9MYCO|nr:MULTISPECIES: type VII secretion protein EccE [Mycobacterium]OHU89454.1 type VII secretion protein EccE [Mycobacterium talmoniae]TDH48795.1 type VII secretion protein EccE [Mycobacterium eburneum]
MTLRLVIILGVLGTGLVGWCMGGYAGAAAGLVLGAVVGVIPWRGTQLWAWLLRWLRRGRPIVLRAPLTVANDRAGGGVRFQDGVAAAAVQVLGKPHAPTLLTGSTATHTDNTLDIADLLPLLHQSLGLAIDSVSVVSVGARRRSTGDYARVYDTLIGTPPYAGRRSTWLMVRVAALDNVEALRWRASVGTAALAAAQRIGAALRQQGIRAKVATATDIVEVERRLGSAALDGAARRRWGSLRGDTGWLTTYRYRPEDITAAKLAQAWTLRADGIVQNVTVFGDGGMTATVTVQTPQPPVSPPSVLLHTLPGQQPAAIAGHLCGPWPADVGRGVLTGPLLVPVGPSGVLLGKSGAGNRLLLPLDDPGEPTRVHIAAEDAVVKRILIRLVATGDRLTVHTRDPRRWASARMPDLVVTDRVRPVTGTTVSVTDGSVAPAPRPNTVITIGEPGRAPADVLIRQTGPGTVDVTAGDRVYPVEVELFRAENRYVSAEAIPPPTPPRIVELEPVE